MRGLKPAWLHIALALISISAANAADLMPPLLAPIYIPPPAFSWAGPYLGATRRLREWFSHPRRPGRCLSGLSGAVERSKQRLCGGRHAWVQLASRQLCLRLGGRLKLARRQVDLRRSQRCDQQFLSVRDESSERSWDRARSTRSRRGSDLALFHGGARFRRGRK
jgi:hypothetical protein